MIICYSLLFIFALYLFILIALPLYIKIMRWGGGKRSTQQSQTCVVHHKRQMVKKEEQMMMTVEMIEVEFRRVRQGVAFSIGPHCKIGREVTASQSGLTRRERCNGPLITSLEADWILMYRYSRFHKPVFPQRGSGQWATQRRPYKCILCHVLQHFTCNWYI